MVKFTEMGGEEEEVKGKPVLARWEFWITVTAAAIMVLGAGRLGEFKMDRAVFAGLAIFVTMAVLKGTQFWFKQISPQAVWENGHNSYTGRIYAIAGFGVIRLGGVIYPIRIEGREGSLIFPITSVTKLGMNGSVLIRSLEYPLSSLAKNLRIALIQGGFPEPFHFGLASEIQLLMKQEVTTELGEHKTIRISDVVDLYTEGNEIISEYEKLTQARQKPAEMVVAEMSRLMSKQQRSTRIKDFGKRLGMLDEEEK